MIDSILQSVRVACQLEPDDETFDNDIISLTNTVLFEMNQVGIGKNAYTIGDTGIETWADFLNGNEPSGVNTLVGMKVRLMFDPPTSSVLLQSLQSQIDRIEWRLYSAVNYGEENQCMK